MPQMNPAINALPPSSISTSQSTAMVYPTQRPAPIYTQPHLLSPPDHQSNGRHQATVVNSNSSSSTNSSNANRLPNVTQATNSPEFIFNQLQRSHPNLNTTPQQTSPQFSSQSIHPSHRARLPNPSTAGNRGPPPSSNTQAVSHPAPPNATSIQGATRPNGGRLAPPPQYPHQNGALNAMRNDPAFFDLNIQNSIRQQFYPDPLPRLPPPPPSGLPSQAAGFSGGVQNNRMPANPRASDHPGHASVPTQPFPPYVPNRVSRMQTTRNDGIGKESRSELTKELLKNR